MLAVAELSLFELCKHFTFVVEKPLHLRSVCGREVSQMIEVSVRACAECIHRKEVAGFILDVLKQFVVLGQCGLSLRTVLAGVRSGASAARRTV